MIELMSTGKQINEIGNKLSNVISTTRKLTLIPKISKSIVQCKKKSTTPENILNQCFIARSRS